jgi:hypothetical protein
LSGYTENGGECQQQHFTHDKLFRNSKVGLFLIKLPGEALRPESKPVSPPFFQAGGGAKEPNIIPPGRRNNVRCRPPTQVDFYRPFIYLLVF